MMLGKTIDETITRMRAAGARLGFLGPTLARITVGLVFIGTGWGKLHNLSDVTSFFTTLHIPAPAFNARLTAATELCGGLAVLLGLATRVASLPLAFVMVIAIATAKRSDITGPTALVGFEEWSYLVLSIWLAVAGAGPLSLDHLLSWLRRRGAARARSPRPLASQRG